MVVEELRECLTALEPAMSLTVPHSWAQREFDTDEGSDLDRAIALLAAECSCSWFSTIEGYTFEKREGAEVPLSEISQRPEPVPLQ